MNPKDLLANLGQNIGLPNLAFSDYNTCRLEVGEGLMVDIEHAAEAGLLHIYAVVGVLPEIGREKLYEKLLTANLFGGGTGGASLAVDVEERQILLCRSFPDELLEPTEFLHLLEGFLAAVKAWTEELAKPGTESSQSVGSVDPGLMLRA